MKNKKFERQHKYYIKNSYGQPFKTETQVRRVKTFSKNYDTGFSVTLECRAETDIVEYEVPNNNTTAFVEYEVVSSNLNKEILSNAATYKEYTVEFNNNNFKVEPFEETTASKQACSNSNIKNDKPEIIPENKNAGAPIEVVNQNKEAKKLLNALSEIASSQSNEELDHAFLEDMKTILTDPKSLRKESNSRQSIHQSEPVAQPTKEEDIFDKIARNMQYANQYDFGTLELDKRFDEFDRLSDLEGQRPTNVNVRARNNSIETVKTQKTYDLSSSDFLEDLDIISNESNTPPASIKSPLKTNNIPLDPGVGGRSIVPSALQVGDVIISTTSNEHISRAIRTATASEVSHGVVYVGNGRVIHSTDLGVTEWTLDELLDNSSLCVAYHHRDMDVAKANRIVQFLRNALITNKGFDSWGVIYAAPSQLLATYCDSMTGATRDACLHSAGSIRPGTDNNDQFYCSELIFAAFQDAGLNISTVQPSFSSPQEIVRLFHDGTFQYVGHLKF